MLLILGIVLPSIAGFATALPSATARPSVTAIASATATAIHRRAVDSLHPISHAPSPKPSSTSPDAGNVEVFSVEYINSNGVTTGGEVTISAPLDAEGTGSYLSDLPRETDPCGPKVQGPDSFPTCSNGTSNSSSELAELGFDPGYVYLSDEPAYYGAQCMNSTDDTSALNAKNCKVSIVDICRKINSRYSPKGKWVWSSVGGPDCAVGYWSPAYNGSAPVPDRTRCEQGIYETMMGLCVTEPDLYFYGVSNMVAVNLVNLPSANSTGSQVNVGYPSYVIAPQKLPIPDNSS